MIANKKVVQTQTHNKQKEDQKASSDELMSSQVIKLKKRHLQKTGKGKSEEKNWKEVR